MRKIVQKSALRSVSVALRRMFFQFAFFSLSHYVSNLMSHLGCSFAASVVDCAKLPTGDYSLGCFAEYFTCLDGVELRRRCPQRLVFSEAKHRCVVPGDCTDVSTHIVTNTVAVPASTPANDVPSVKGSFMCRSLSFSMVSSLPPVLKCNSFL